MTRLVRARAAALVLPFAVAACTQQPVRTPTRSLDAPSDAALVCARTDGQGNVTVLPLSRCQPSELARNHDFARLYLLVTNETRGELALVSAGSTNLNALDAGDPLNGDAGAQIDDLDPTQPGYGFLTLGALPEPVRTSADGCAAVTSNQGDCSLSVVDVRALIQVPSCRLPEAKGNAACPGQMSMSQLVSRVVRPVAPRIGSRLLGARPTWVELSPATSGDPVNGAAMCETHGRRAIVAFPSCQLVAEVNLDDGQLTQAVRITRDGPPRVLSPAELGALTCDAECRPAIVSPPDLNTSIDDGDTAGEDAGPPGDGGATGLDDGGTTSSGDGGLPPIFPTSQAYPHALAIEAEGASPVVYVADAVSGTIAVLPLTDGAWATPSRIALSGDPGGVERMRISPPIESLAYCLDGSDIAQPCAAGTGGRTVPRYLYAIARDRSVRVVETTFHGGTECETNPDPDALLSSPLLGSATSAADAATKLLEDLGQPDRTAWRTERRLHCLPAGVTRRAALATSPGINLPGGLLARDVTFIRLDNPPIAQNMLPAPSAAPGVLLGDFAFLVDTAGRLSAMNLADLCPQPNIIDANDTKTPSCRPESFRKFENIGQDIDPTSPKDANNPWFGALLAPPRPSPLDVMPNRVRNGTQRFVPPTNLTSDVNGGAHLSGFPLLTGTTAQFTDEGMPHFCDLAAKACPPPPTASQNVSPSQLIELRDQPIASAETWTFAWEGELPGTPHTTGSIQPPDGLLDPSAALCTRGVRPGDKLLIHNCNDDSQCAPNQACFHAALGPGLGLCLARDPSDALKTECLPWTTAILRYRIVAAQQNQLQFEELYEPEHPADTHACDPAGPDTCGDVQVMVPQTGGLAKPSPTKCLPDGHGGGACLLPCTLDPANPTSGGCGAGYVCGTPPARVDPTRAPRCMRAPLPADSKCFEQLHPYSVLAGESFLVIGSATGFLHHDFPDPVTQVCRRPDETQPEARANGRLPLVFGSAAAAAQLTPFCGPKVVESWSSSDFAAGNRDPGFTANACALPPSVKACQQAADCGPGGECVAGGCRVCTRDADCAEGGCYLWYCGDRARLHYENPIFTMVLEVPQRVVQPTTLAVSPARVTRVPDDGAILTAGVIGGFGPLAFRPAVDVGLLMPRAVVTGPDRSTIYVVDEGRQPSGSGVRGQLLRFFTDTLTTDSTFVIR